jgi:hypothetical protein
MPKSSTARQRCPTFRDKGTLTRILRRRDEILSRRQRERLATDHEAQVARRLLGELGETRRRVRLAAGRRQELVVRGGGNIDERGACVKR